MKDQEDITFAITTLQSILDLVMQFMGIIEVFFGLLGGLFSSK